MKIASLNCNKRLSNPKANNLLRKWLDDNNIDLLLTQEPWPHSLISPVSLLGYRGLGGNSRVYSWGKESCIFEESKLLTPYMQQIKADYLWINNLYLDAYSRKTRSEQLMLMQEHLSKLDDQPMLILGDFNLAPNFEDGISGNSFSNFNGTEDRGAFLDTLKNLKLIDTTNKSELGKQEYSIEKKIGQTQTQFRCDLCLSSDYFFSSNGFSIKYDHTVRDKILGFSDHSALILGLPVTIFRKKIEFQATLFDQEDASQPIDELSEVHYHPHKTAIARSSPSPAARLVVSGVFSELLGKNFKILDYGCGRGRDIEFYREKGFAAEGYDPYPQFGFTQQPSGLYDLVCVVFVLNVLPNIWERLLVIKKASEFLKQGGLLLLVTRSNETINQEAKSKGWKQHNDGYWSHEGKRTFQKGITSNEMEILIERVGMKPHPFSKKIKFDFSTSHLLAQKQ